VHKELVLINCVKILISVHLPFCDLIKIFILILNIVLFFFKYSSETEGAALKCCCSYGKSCLVVKPGCRPPPFPEYSFMVHRYDFTLLYFNYVTSLRCTSLYFTVLHSTSFYFTSLLFTSLCHFTSLYFTLLQFMQLYFTSIHFTLLHFMSLYFTLLYFTLRSVSHFAAYSLCTPHIVTLFLSLPSFASQHVGFLLDAYLCCITFVSSVDGQVACLLET